MLPRSIPQLKNVISLVNLLPPQINELIRAEASFIAQGRLRPREATIDMLESVNVDPARGLSRPQGMMVGALFALARTVGWVAQWNEMIADPEQKIGRPRQLYTGATQRDYVSAANR